MTQSATARTVASRRLPAPLSNWELQTLGEALRYRRKELGIGLREFCKLIDMDPANYARIETTDPDRLRIPSELILGKIAGALQIAQGTEAWERLLAYRDAAQGRFPDELLSSTEFRKALPRFFHQLRCEHRKGTPTKRLLGRAVKNTT